MPLFCGYGLTFPHYIHFEHLLHSIKGISISGQRAGEYEIKAYTAVAANIQGGRLFVKTPDEVSGFTILD